MKPFIKIDETLSLHLARHELAEPIFQVVNENRDFLRQWLPWVDDTRAVEDTKTFIREAMQHNSDGSRLTTFIMANDQLAGSLGVIHFNREHLRCEIGYWLRKDLQGQGIMTKAGEAFIDFLFKTKRIHRLEILIIPQNLPSRAVAQRLGFRSEGILRKALNMYGSFHDVEVFGLLREEWSLQKKS